MAPGIQEKWANIGPFTPNILHIRQNPVVRAATTTTRKKKAHSALEAGDFLRGVTRFSRPHIVTGFKKRQNPDTMYGHIGQL